MSRPRRRRSHAIRRRPRAYRVAMNRECPRCKASPGDPCRSPSGRRLYSPPFHLDRRSGNATGFASEALLHNVTRWLHLRRNLSRLMASALAELMLPPPGREPLDPHPATASALVHRGYAYRLSDGLQLAPKGAQLRDEIVPYMFGVSTKVVDQIRHRLHFKDYETEDAVVSLLEGTRRMRKALGMPNDLTTRIAIAASVLSTVPEDED